MSGTFSVFLGRSQIHHLGLVLHVVKCIIWEITSLYFTIRSEKYIILGGGCMNESDMSDMGNIETINYFNLKRRCFYELQPKNSKKQI